MGAWTFVERQLRPSLGDRQLRYIGRPESPSPAEGRSATHAAERLEHTESTTEELP